MQIYLDNAATTPMAPEVIEVMTEIMKDDYGNPSSIHSHGRQAKTLVEKARKTVAQLLGVSPAEIFFTSGGTEADNMALRCSIADLGIKHVITTPIEHHAVLHTLEELHKKGDIKLILLSIDDKGDIDLQELRDLLAAHPETMVSIMHANNEIGNIYDIQQIAAICDEHKAFFHSDTVQTIGHLPLDLSNTTIDFITASAHKFHGPKGVGFLYINGKNKINPLIFGGAQERNMRGGTENIYGIVGLAKALELSIQNMQEHRDHVVKLKSHMIDALKEHIPGVSFNGRSAEIENSLYTVLNVSFPCTEMMDMLLFNLDIKGISASGGSACSSGSNIGSHVLHAIKADSERPSIRFSFSKFNTIEDIDKTVEILKGICKSS
ncbi:MAG TPA: cysteine desulfurase family protein [Candidatus Sphingobacterium stercoripullorum]|nr:cysteine desulfurase family protein [Candidatus Sphingobacterium stercoripullorum]